jgi:KDO2-lipid IV(A) lauroyltransferase
VVSFGGLVVSATPAHVAIAKKTGAAIVPIECRPLPDGRYRIVHHKPIECPEDADTRALAQQCWDALEPAVREQPECWLWPYKHWRYHPSKNHARYPSYAAPSARFDALAAALLVEKAPPAN